MSYILFKQRCLKCGADWNAAFGIVGMTQIAAPPKSCPECGSQEIERTDFISLKEKTKVATITTGRTVLYILTQQDAIAINLRRAAGQNHDLAGGAQKHIGNYHSEGQIVPLIVVVVWPNEYGPDFHGVNGQAILDGNDTLWVTSAKEGTEPGTWHWPPIVLSDVADYASANPPVFSEATLAATA